MFWNWQLSACLRVIEVQLHLCVLIFFFISYRQHILFHGNSLVSIFQFLNFCTKLFHFFSCFPFRNSFENLLLFVVVRNNSLWICEIAFEPTLNATRAKCAFYDLHSFIRLLYAMQKFYYYFFLCVLSAHTQAACSECTKRKFIIEQNFIYLQLNLFAYEKTMQQQYMCTSPVCW